MMVPLSFRNTARSLDSDSTVVSGRMPWSESTTTGSPLRCGISIGAISCAKMPSAWALAARWCDSAATSSWSVREMPRSAFGPSVSVPMDTQS